MKKRDRLREEITALEAQVSKDDALIAVAENLDTFLDLVAFYMGKQSKLGEKGFSINEPIDEDAAIAGATLSIVALKYNTKTLCVNVDEIEEVCEWLRAYIAIHKMQALGLIGFGEEKDQYGFPVITITPEQIEKLRELSK